MRKILFRGKSKESKSHKWYFGGYVAYNCISTIDGEVIVFPETMGQYTGFDDKNGTEVFEGDIIKIDDKYIRYIEYSGECASFVKFRYINKLTSEFSGYLGKGYDNYKQTIEVIGNIHDTPELLKESEDTE